MNKIDNLHNVKIIGDGKQHHVLIDDKNIEGVLEANLSIKPCECAQLIMKTDVKVNSIELKAEVEEIQNNTINFGQALEKLKQGKKVARKGWNGKKMFLYLTSNSIVPFEKLNFAAHTHVTKESTGRSSAYINPHIDMKTADGTITIGWAPSQVDMLVEDWEEVE